MNYNLKSEKSEAEAFGDIIHLRGIYEVGLYGPNDELQDYRRVENTVVTGGRAWVLSRIMSQAPDTNTINAIGIGTSVTAGGASDSALVSEPKRLQVVTFITGGLTNAPPSWQAQVTFATSDANTTLGEAGMFNSTSAGTMLSRVTFATINKASTNTLAISYTISN